MESIAVIFNPASRRGRSVARLAELQALFAEAGYRAEILATRGPGHASELAMKAKSAGVRIVAAAGGDGTVHEVVNGLMHAATPGTPAGPLAILPLGTGNDFATHLRIPRRAGDAVRVVAQGRVHRIDLGVATLREQDRIRRRYFNNGMGLGLEASVTLASREIHRLHGLGLYLMAALKTLPRMQAVAMDVSAECTDGRTWQRSAPTLMVTIGNSPRSGGGFHLTPAARVDDGALDVGIAAAMSIPQLCALLPRAIRGKHTNHPAVTMLRVWGLRADVPVGVPVQLDGEIVAHAAQEIHVDVVPTCLDVIVSQTRPG